MHKLDQCENNVGKSSAGVSWLDETEGIEIMGEKPTVAPTFKPTKAPPVQKPTQGPVQQKPTQGPVQQKPTQAPVQQKPPVNLKPTQAPSKKLKPTIAPPRKLKPTQAPVEQVKPTQAPVQQKPTQGPVQQKPTQGPVQQKPTQSPVQQKPTQAPTQAPVQQKPTEAPVQQKPTQSPVQQKPTQAPWIDYPVQELPIEYLPPVQQQKPTQGPVQQKPTESPVQQKPTQAPVQQKPTQLPWRQTKPTQAPVEQVKPTQSPWQDYPGQEMPVEYLPPAKEKPTQSPVHQKPIQSPVQQKPTQAPNQIRPTQEPWQQEPWQQQQEWSDDLWAGEDKYLGEMDWDKEPYAELPAEYEEEQLLQPIKKPGSWRGEPWQKPVPVDLAILRDDLSWQAKAIDYYFKAAEEMDNSYCEFFQTKGKEEVRCFKQVLILLNSLNDNGYGQMPQQSLEEFLDWETGSKYWDDYLDDGLPGSKESGQKQKQSDARQRPRGGFFAPPGRYPRSRMINKPKVRACLTGAVQMVAEAITIYEEQIKHLGHPVVRNLLIRILMHEKKVLAELTEKLLEVLPKES